MISDVSFPRVNRVSTSIATSRQSLAELGHQSTLIAPAYPTSTADDEGVIRIRSRGVPRDPEDRMMSRRQIDALAPRLLEGAYDAVHIHTPFVAHYAGVALARRLRVLVIETYHTFFEEYLHHYVPLLPRAATRWLARRMSVSQCAAVDALVVPSRQMLGRLRGYGIRTRADVLPTGVDLARFRGGDGQAFRRSHGIAPDRPVLVHISRVAHEKNIDFVVRALAVIRRQVPDVLLVIAGEGPALAHLKSRTARLGLEQSVLFVGYLERCGALLDCYCAGDAFVFASRTETEGAGIAGSSGAGRAGGLYGGHGHRRRPGRRCGRGRRAGRDRGLRCHRRHGARRRRAAPAPRARRTARCVSLVGGGDGDAARGPVRGAGNFGGRLAL